MIRVNDLEKYFDSGAGRFYVLRRINLEIREGDFVTIMGPSGAGKSTLLEHSRDAGQRLARRVLPGRPPCPQAEAERADRAQQEVHRLSSFQSYHLLDDLTVYENLDLPLSYRNIKGSERASIVCDTLDRFQIVGKKDLFPNQLSGGQQQLVAVARAVIANPKIILADEPTGNLHSSQGDEIMELFTKLNREGTTIIQVTHSEKNAGFGDRIIFLRDGWIDRDERVREAVAVPQV